MTSLVVNARFLTQRVTGVQRYAIEVSRRIKRMEPATRFLMPSGAIHPELVTELGAECVGRLRGHAWEQLELPLYLRGAGLIGLCNAAPLGVTRQIVTIHDAAPFAVPEAHSRAYGLWYRLLLRRAGGAARRIVTVSRFSAEQLERLAGIPAAKIEVVPLGREHITTLPRDSRILARHDLVDRPFLLAVGSRSPHKNFAALLRAARRLTDAPFLFVIAGGVSTKVHAASSEELPTSNVRYVGAVSDSELRALYEHAAGYVHPAYYEGFGLPPLEAMTLGCPVLSARAASLPEVIGDAGAYFDPFDDDDITGAIARFMADEPLRAALSERGRRRAELFSWDRCAEQVLDIARRAFD